MSDSDWCYTGDAQTSECSHCYGDLRTENAALKTALAERERVKDKQIEEMIDALKKSMRGCCGHMAQCCEVCLYARVALESVAELELTLAVPTTPQQES